MKLDVELRVFVEMSAHRAVLKGREHAAQRGDLFVAGLHGDQPRRHAFQRRPHGDQLDDLAPALAHHIDAAPRLGAHKTLALELRHRLAHRRAADAEVGGETPFVEPDLGATAVHVHGRDGVLERRVGLALQTRRPLERIHGNAPLRRVRPAPRRRSHEKKKSSNSYWNTLYQPRAHSKVSPPSPRTPKGPCPRAGPLSGKIAQLSFIADLRSGRSTSGAITAATTFIIAATTKTAFQFPVTEVSTLASGTRSDAVPFAVYSMP